MPATPLRTRFAPTPSGLLHPGNGLSFIMTWVIARAYGGQILLRIDDLDKARTRTAYVEDVFRTLEWLGLDYDEGPQGVAGFFRDWSQHTRLGRYESYLQQLLNAGQLFACTCSRRQIREISRDGSYPGTCRHKHRAFDAPNTAWRVEAPAEGDEVAFRQWQAGWQRVSLSGIDAFVVRQKNGYPAYQLASLADDTHFGINFVVRGSDLWASTLSQHYLAERLELNAFQQATFWHHPLLTEKGGQKLSKSKGAGSLQAWREAGRPPGKLFLEAGRQLGLPQQTPTLAALVDGLKSNL